MRISTSGLKQQFISVNGIVNARDLGGYMMQDGRRLHDGMFIRSAHLADATDADLEYLSTLPVAKVIDFRKDEEKRGKVDRMVTGAASALILAALGADRETIIADFDATNRVYEADVRRCCRNVRLMGGKETELATVKSFLGANTENFIKVLDRH